uniref:Uncharacterized protein n=1 Tax=Timema genevievae TaxID=629358 RepID=A0A7R9K7I2_TIMGE|nr:unnamed protein product [Timema genevievae]
MKRPHATLGIPRLDPFYLKYLDIGHDIPEISRIRMVGRLESMVATSREFAWWVGWRAWLPHRGSLRGGMSGHVEDVTIWNLSTYQVKHFTIRWEDSAVHLNLFFPELLLKGHYEINGSFGNAIYAYGKGPFTVRLIGLEVSGVTTATFQDKALFLESLILDFTIQRYEGNLENMMGDEKLSQLINRMLNDSLVDVLNYFKPNISKVISKKALDFGNSYLKEMSFSQDDILSWLPGGSQVRNTWNTLLANAPVVLSSTTEDGEIEVRISVGVRGTLDNVMVSKLAMFVVDNLGVECERNLFKVDFHLMFPYLLVTGVYNVSGESRGHSKLYGDGGFSAIDLFIEDGKIALVVDNQYNSRVERDYLMYPLLKVNFENFLGGGDAGVFINELLGYMADMILSHIRDKMDDYLANILLDYVNSRLQGRTRGQVEGFVRAIDNGTIPFDFLL